MSVLTGTGVLRRLHHSEAAQWRSIVRVVTVIGHVVIRQNERRSTPHFFRRVVPCQRTDLSGDL